MATNAATAPMHKNRITTVGRIAGYISKTDIFKSINFSSKLYSEVAETINITTWPLPGGSGAWKNFTFRQIMGMPFVPTAIGNEFGPLWATHWFKLVITVPQSWTGKEVHLRWNSGSEATIWRDDGGIGELLQGISQDFRTEYIISRNWSGLQPVELYVEMACNSMFGSGDDVYDSEITPPDPFKMYTLKQVDIAVFERTIFKLYTDLEILYQMAEAMPNDHKGYQAMFVANNMVTFLKKGRNEEASQLADQFFSEGTGKKAHHIISMGNCHIDTAWLWPYDETIRKIARSWASQMKLMEEYEEFTFVCSQAQQYEWLKQYFPQVFTQLKAAIVSGRFIPVGGCWIEMDGNMPNGESFMRQFFYGQRFFRDEFSFLCREFWLPDTFGYSAQIPQMMKHIGINRFLSQKLSWNLVNKFPNHNFWWEGIDGTQVLVHFPPGNTYNMRGTVQEVLFTQNNSEDKGRSNVSIYLYGIGDGGGGPNRGMIERQKRLKDIDGLPTLQLGTPEDFWLALEKESSKLYKWVGELYLELHNGTYTSQARIKWYNRKCEFFFREVELLIAIALSSGKIDEPTLIADVATVDKNWKQYLLNQFHDVLPGSCIEMVAVDAWAVYAEVFNELDVLRKKYHLLLLGTGTTPTLYNPLSDCRMVIFNKPDIGSPIAGENIQSVTLDPTAIEDSEEGRYRVPNSFSAALVEMKASGYSTFTALAPTTPVTYQANATTGTLQNGTLRLEVSLSGPPIETLYFTGPSGIEKSVYSDRLNTGTTPATLYIYDDLPLFWDAWDVMDYHLETRELPEYSSAPNITPFATGPIVGGYKWSAGFGNNGSTVERYAIMRAESPMIEYYLIVDWKESHSFLKVEFPVDVLTREATYEIQYGHAKRSTHINTSWDMAKFEVCGHKWMDVSQPGKGVTFITDSKYGWHVRDNIVKMSLLRSPKNPDGNCDMHKHYIYYAVLPHEGTFQQSDVIRRAYELNYHSSNNVPILMAASTTVPQNWITVSHTAVIIEALKAAHDRADAIVVRLYESHGGSADTRITIGFPFTKVSVCNGLEIVEEDIPFSGNYFETTFNPFQIRTFLITM